MKKEITELECLCFARHFLHQPLGAACPPRQVEKIPISIFSNVAYRESGGNSVEDFGKVANSMHHRMIELFQLEETF